MEPRLHLARFFRVFRHAEQTFLETLLEEQTVPLDDVALGLLRALEASGPRVPGKQACRPMDGDPNPSGAAPSELSAALGVAPGEVLRAYGLLSRLGVVRPAPETAESSLASAYAVFERTREALPVVDQVELTNHCPMTCFMCPTGEGTMTRPRGFMARPLFERLVAEIAEHQARWKPLTLHNLGESTLHPELPAFVAIAAARGLDTELASNPGFMPLELYRALTGAGLGRLVLDLDGLDVETLEAVRGKGVRAGKAFSNLDAILSLRARSPAEKPRLVLQMIGLDRNRHQHAEFIRRYGALELAGVEAYVKEPDANTAPSAGHPIFISGNAPRPSLCRAPWRSVVVLWDGRVVPCCHDANGDVVYGTLETQTLAEIWSGVEATALRARLREGRIRAGEACHGCAHRPDRFVRAPLDVLPVQPLHW